MAVTMTYGAYNFSPVPLIDITKSYFQLGDGTRIGTVFNMTLDGVLTPLPNGSGGITPTMALTNTMREAFVQDGCPFVIKCDSTTLWSGHPNVGVLNFEQTNNNWINTIAYTIPLSFHTEGSGEDPSLTPPYIQGADENWSVGFVDNQSKYSLALIGGIDTNATILNVDHFISARGVRNYTGCNIVLKEPWEYARDYVITKLSVGMDSAFNTQLEGSGIINLSSSSFNSFNHIRIQQNDIANGEFSVTESWLVVESGVGLGSGYNAIEDISVNTQEAANTDIKTITIDGSIQGLETRTYGSSPGSFTITETKYAAASGYYQIIKPWIPYRVSTIGATVNPTRSFNGIPLSVSVGHNLNQGQITYSYVYDDRPSNAITGALTEIITINDNNPNDVFAVISVMGRRLGPVLQDVNTITNPTRDISIECLCAPITATTASTLRTPPNNVRTDVQTLLCGFQAELTGAYSQVFKQNDTESWSPRDGRYSRSVSFIFQDCSTTGVTSLCG